MRLDTEQELQNNLDDAETLGICMFVASNRESKVLRRRLESGELVSPRRGMYARGPYWERLSPAEQALHVMRTLGIAHPTWTFSHASAALAHGIDVSYATLRPIHFMAPASEGGRSPSGLRRHRSACDQTTVAGRIRVTDIDHTVIDCATQYSPSLFLPIGDAAVRAGLTTPERLERELAARRGGRGMRKARRHVSLIDPRAESGGESFVRGRLIELGIPFIDLQGAVANPEQPWRTYRMDIVLARPDGTYVDLEVDGAEKYVNSEMNGGKGLARAMMEERQREAAITSHGIMVARVTPWQARNDALLKGRLAAYGIFPRADGD